MAWLDELCIAFSSFPIVLVKNLPVSFFVVFRADPVMRARLSMVDDDLRRAVFSDSAWRLARAKSGLALAACRGSCGLERPRLEVSEAFGESGLTRWELIREYVAAFAGS